MSNVISRQRTRKGVREKNQNNSECDAEQPVPHHDVLQLYFAGQHGNNFIHNVFLRIVHPTIYLTLHRVSFNYNTVEYKLIYSICYIAAVFGASY